MTAGGHDVAVLGGGAAGLLAAWRAATGGARVLLLEKNRKPGAKILASGGTRCNLTTTREGVALERSFRERQGAWLRFALRALPPARLRAWFDERGVATREERWEKVFPVAGRASVVLEALLAAAVEAGVSIVERAPVTAVMPDGGGFRIETAAESHRARTVILATGGKSYPKSGTTGDGYRIAAALGHGVSPLRPGLAGLSCEDPRIAALAGITVEEVSVTLLEGGRGVASFRRPVLFTHRGLSGPGPMDLACEVAARGGADLVLDLAPDFTASDLDRAAADALRRAPTRAVAHALPIPLPERLAALVCAVAGIPEATRAAQLDRGSRRRLVATLKAFPVRASGTLGFDHAEVTCGGIALDEVDPRTMQSRISEGLYVCGEVLDVDGPIGGFNFQAAFATGWVAGESAARAALRPGAGAD